MKKELLLPYAIEKNLNLSQKKEYYNYLRKTCKQLSLYKKGNMNIGQKCMSQLYMTSFYNQLLNIDNIQNIPKGIPSIFVCNHSTAHDIFSMYIAMEKIGLKTSVMVATDCINPFSEFVFSLANSVFLNRNNKLSSSNSILEASATLMSGKNLVIFGESTWNLHPIKIMQDIKKGGAMISVITGLPVIPTILEYVETPNIADKEKNIYRKIVLRFGNPYYISENDDIIEKTLLIQKEMEEMRKNIWIENNIDRTILSDVNSNIYLNHTYLKKFGVFGFTYNSEYEAKFLRSNDGSSTIENEYFLNENNEFKPGVTYKKK